MPGKSADDKKSSVNKGAKRNFNKAVKAKRATPPKPRAKPARKATPPKPRAKPARKASPPKPRAKPSRAKSGASRSTAGKKVSKPRAGMKSKGPAPKSNKSRKGHRLDRSR